MSAMTAASELDPPDPVGQHDDGSRRVVWNQTELGPACPSRAFFDFGGWQASGRVEGQGIGRGQALFIVGEGGARWVLRHYRRGGVIAHLNADRYFGPLNDRCRPMREFDLLTRLRAIGLDVPRPIAAQAVRSAGLAYRADLVTERIIDSSPLADHLTRIRLAQIHWRHLGRTLARLHTCGVWHADLNARNVLIDADDRFYLIDFDRARFRADGSWRQANLKRFRRSLDKFAGRWATFNFAEADWQALLEGYREAFGRL
ncbi:3-deoxy-D-manno-octulosonic acid kinase [Salinisphaera hydrothermalis]|uniref:3-deoxy-D-manno-octulosonic acid kinase n=1 Tax=Salinisphaera hydrothermalis TaxID=563188 RepID=UPI0018DD1320|nr:3-deoxy-D-manno-octulosonic acid kinase [Salinisphaera hydrothermalis]